MVIIHKYGGLFNVVLLLLFYFIISRLHNILDSGEENIKDQLIKVLALEMASRVPTDGYFEATISIERREAPEGI